MSEKRAKSCLIAAVLWCFILVVLGVGYKFLVHPYFQEKTVEDTSSSSQYSTEIVIAADSFSGYSILRSDAVAQTLKQHEIKLTFQDDQADYAARLEALQDGDVQLAVFTIDSFITAGAKAGEYPASIVAIIDETKGGDAMVANEAAIKSIQDLDQSDSRIVLTPESPSEFLARVVIAHFNLPNLSTQWLESADGAEDVLRRLKRNGPQAKKAYVLWEPYVTQALEEPGLKTLLDTSKLRGYVVDVLVAEREFLRDHQDQVQRVVDAYFRAAYQHSQSANGMVQLVQSDARRFGSQSLGDAQAKNVVNGIRWKNTLENYAHFGLDDAASSGELQHIEDMIANIMDVLLKTKALDRDPLDGQHHRLFFDQVLARLKSDNFHPGQDLNIISDLGAGLEDLESVRADVQAQKLSDAQWQRLQPVGELDVESIVFRTGSDIMSIGSRRELEALAKRLATFPQFYVRVIGQTRAEGDPEANRILAQNRASAAANLLTANGVSPDRIKTEAAPSQARSGEAQAVSFIVGQLPY